MAPMAHVCHSTDLADVVLNDLLSKVHISYVACPANKDKDLHSVPEFKR